MTSLYAGLEKGRPYILSVLRIVVALLFMEHGLQKYFGFPSAGPPMRTLLYVQGVIEIVGGILLFIGASSSSTSSSPAAGPGASIAPF
jgi:putative oxidoreductase